MHRLTSPSRGGIAIERARLFDELDQSLGEVERLTATLYADPAEHSEIAALRSRILFVRAALESLRREAPQVIGPEWSDLMGWLAMMNPGR